MKERKKESKLTQKKKWKVEVEKYSFFFFVFFFGHPQIFRFIINFVWHTHSLTHSLNMCDVLLYVCVCDPNGGNTHSLSHFVSLSILLKKKTLVIFLNIVAIYIYPNHHQQLTTNNYPPTTTAYNIQFRQSLVYRRLIITT